MKRVYHHLFNYFVCCFLLCNLTAFSNITNTYKSTLVTTSTPYNITDTAATVDISINVTAPAPLANVRLYRILTDVTNNNTEETLILNQDINNFTASTTINIPNHQLTNLTPNTEYEIKFRTDAQDLENNNTIAETNTQTFTTLQIKAYVDISNTTGNNDGNSWETAYTNLQQAIDNIEPDGEIWVANGTYYPTDSPDETSENSKNYAFHINKNLKIYGGFEGTETTLEERVLGNNTILSGDLGIVDNISDNAYHVLITTNLDNNTIIDSFTITNGNADDDTNGSIVYNTLFFSNNNGGGILNIQSSPNITNVTFNDNKGRFGGAMSNLDSSSPNITNTIFNNNVATRDGGGIYNNASSPNITNVTFSNNMADINGGGLYNQASSPIIIHTIFNNNISNDKGGGIFNSIGSSNTITNTTFYNNKAESNGAGIYSGFFGDFIMNNTVFYNNNTSSRINDVFFEAGINATGSNNASDDAITLKISDLLILTSDPFLNSSDPDGADDIFATEDDGLSLSTNSPLINAGDSTLNNETFDITSNTRINDASIDIGPYEYQGATLSTDAIINTTETSIYQSQKNELTFNGTNLEEISSLQIYTLTGKQVVDINVQLSAYNNKVIINDLSKGLYIVNIVASDKTVSKKIILY